MTDYCNQSSSGLITVAQALEEIHHSIVPVHSEESVSLKFAFGRILAKPVYSTVDIPPFKNSSVDGYAFSCRDMNKDNPFTLKLSDTSWAGTPNPNRLTPGTCVRIFTGAVVPEGADSIIMQEEISATDLTIKFPAGVKPFQNIRNAGEDIKQGTLLFKSPRKITAIDLGLLAACGINHISVKRKVRIAFFSTGDELIEIGHALQLGQIHDSNRYSLSGLLKDDNYDVADLGVIADDKQLLSDTLIKTARRYDLILTTGGASVGDADYIKQILDEIGKVNFWKLAMKPGKPLAYGKIGTCIFIGLPGNPVSVIATYHQIVAPALKLISGLEPHRLIRLKAKCTGPLYKTPGRQEFQRGVFSQMENGDFVVESAGKQGSHILSSMSKANCYIVLPAQCTGVQQGEWVEIQLFKDLF